MKKRDIMGTFPNMCMGQLKWIWHNFSHPVKQKWISPCVQPAFRRQEIYSLIFTYIHTPALKYDFKEAHIKWDIYISHFICACYVYKYNFFSCVYKYNFLLVCIKGEKGACNIALIRYTGYCRRVAKTNMHPIKVKV